jgi:hypothetical protein
MKNFFGTLIALVVVCSPAVKAADWDLSGNVEMHSRMISPVSGINYSENPTLSAQFAVTKGPLSFVGFYSADLKDSQTLANLQEFILVGSKKVGKTQLVGMFETVRFSPLDGVCLYPSVQLIQPLGGGVEIDFQYRYNVEGLYYDDLKNSSSSHIGLTKKFDGWSILARGHRDSSRTNFSSAVTKEIAKNISATGFYHVIDVIGSPVHFGGVKVGYSF